MAAIDKLFDILINHNGSDLHLEEGQKPKLRVNGILTCLNADVLTSENMVQLLSEIADPDDWKHFQSHGDLDFAYCLKNDYRFRANYFRHFFGLGAVFRMIPSKIRTLEELSLPECVKDFTQLRSGIVLVTGPTGSGKSTTLAAMIDYINQNFNQKIITIEEPVEFTHTSKSSLITHREVGKDTASFAMGLRTAIKSDVNVILVGEMRDKETIELALTASEMGILVFGTLHTNSAAKTIDRVIDSFGSEQKNQIRNILANNLKAIIAQQLLPSVDQTCRYAAYEILIRTTALGNIIQSGESIRLNNEIQMNKAKGMILMDDSLMGLVQAGKISKEAAYLKAINKSRFGNLASTETTTL